MKNLEISFIGAGNAAHRLSISFIKEGVHISHICNRSIERAHLLANILNREEVNIHHLNPVKFTDRISDLNGADIIIIAVSDDAIREVAQQIYTLDNVQDGNSIILHTSGSTDISVLNIFKRYGVFYPLMTLSKIKPLEMSDVPFLLEASDPNTEKILIDLAKILKSEYHITSSKGRLKFHLSAVFVSNFVNHILGMAFDMARENYMLLMPLALETVRKAFLYDHPKKVQTGPAIRRDVETIQKHVELLKKDGNDEMLNLYIMLTDLIIKAHHNKSCNYNKE